MTGQPVPAISTTVAVGEPGSVSVTVAGELDMLSAPDLVAVLRGALSRYKPGRLDLDLAAVPFMDSTGIQVLMAANTDAAAHGGRVRIIRASPEVLRVLTLTGLLETFGLTG